MFDLQMSIVLFTSKYTQEIYLHNSEFYPTDVSWILVRDTAALLTYSILEHDILIQKYIFIRSENLIRRELGT